MQVSSLDFPLPSAVRQHLNGRAAADGEKTRIVTSRHRTMGLPSVLRILWVLGALWVLGTLWVLLISHLPELIQFSQDGPFSKSQDTQDNQIGYWNKH